jgi:repressor of nif and glnA expression
MSQDINLTSGDRQYLAVIEALDGQASTREIRKRVDDWDDRAVRYRHSRHERFGTVKISKDNDRTPVDVSAMKVAHLTETGEKLIAEGAAVDTEVEQTTEEQLEEVTERLDELEDIMEGAFPWLNEFAARVRRLENAFENVGGESIDEYGDIEEYQ